MKRVRINNNITAPRVRLIAADGSQIGEVSLNEAQNQAQEAKLDLVEIAPEAKPPVCRIMDYGKYLFEQSKRSKKKSKQIQIKEIKMRPGTDIGDYNVKVRKVIDFLQQGNKVKVTIRFRGREMAHQQLGRDMLKRVEEDIVEIGNVEQFPKMEGRQIVMVVGPKKK